MDKLEVHILLQSIGFYDLMYVLCDFEDVAIRYIKHYVRFFGEDVCESRMAIPY